MKPHNNARPHPRTAPTGNGWTGYYRYKGNDPWAPKKKSQ